MNGSRGDGPDKSNKCGGGLLRSTLVHVIDDDPGICDAMQMLLSTVGFEFGPMALRRSSWSRQNCSTAGARWRTSACRERPASNWWRS